MYSGEAVEGVEVAEDGEITQVRNMLQLAPLLSLHVDVRQ